MKPAIFLSLFFLSGCFFSHNNGYQASLKMQLDTIYANDIVGSNPTSRTKLI